MTAQIADRVLHNGLEFTLVGVAGNGLFDPAAHGVHPVSLSTACWRGFHCVYQVVTTRLLLRDVFLGLDDRDAQQATSGTGPVLLGRVPLPERGGGHWSHNFFLKNVSEPMPFSGGIVLGRELSRELHHPNMGFPAAFHFDVVLELEFAQGRLHAAHDHSEALREKREELAAREVILGRNDTDAFVQRCFSLDYGKSGL